jgi:hypothetical protein
VDGLSLGIAIMAVMKFYKISFLIGFHVSAVVGVFAAIDLAVQGRTGPAITLAILSTVIAVALALWWIVQIAKYSVETRERIKKGVDVISLAFIAVAIGVILRFSVWGESPRAPEHLSIESKIIVWDIVPFSFGFIWLIARYANALGRRFPFLFSHDGRRGLLFYFAQFVLALAFFERLFAFPDWILALLWIAVIGGFMSFAFRQASKTNLTTDNRDDRGSFNGPSESHTASPD